MPPKKASNAKSSSKKTEDVKQEDLKKMIKSMHTHMIKMESRICELMVDEEKKAVFINTLKKRDEFKQAKNSAIEQWKSYQKSLLEDTNEEFPSFEMYKDMHDEIWKEFNNKYPPKKERTEEQEQKRSKRMKLKWEKLNSTRTGQVPQTPEADSTPGEVPKTPEAKSTSEEKPQTPAGQTTNLTSKMPSYLRPFRH